MKIIIQESETVLRAEPDQVVIISQSGPPGPAGGGGGGGVTDGDKGDLVVTGTGTVWTIKAPLLAAAGTGTLAAHVAAPDPHPQYALITAVGAAIATREPVISGGTTAQYWRGDKTWQTLNAAAVGLANVNNTSDAAKPVSAATQTALDLKANLASPTFTGTVSGITRGMVGLSNVDNTSDAAKPVSTAQQTAINAREPTITAGTVGQYWRGDKSWQALNASAVGLANVDNTADNAKPLFTTSVRGLVPGSGGGTTNFLRADGSWIAPPGGGGGSPGGLNRQVQFNAAGSFGGSSELVIGSDGGAAIAFGAFNSALPPPEAGLLKLFSKQKGGRALLSARCPSGLDTSLQPHIGLSTARFAKASLAAATLSLFGWAVNPVAIGTATSAFGSDGSFFGRLNRIGYLSAATAGSQCGLRTTNSSQHIYARAGREGWFTVIRFGIIATVSDRQLLVGVHAAATAPTGEPSTAVNAIFLGMDSTDVNLQIMHNDAAGLCTKVDLGTAFPAPIAGQDVYEVRISQNPGQLVFGWFVENLVTGAQANGEIVSNAPGLGVQQSPILVLSNGATAVAVQIALNSLYLETDY